MKLKVFTLFALICVAIVSASGCSFGVLDNEYQYSVVKKSSVPDASSVLESSSDAGDSSSASVSFEAESSSEHEEFAFTLDDKSNGIIITKYNGQDTNAVIPSVINGKKVVGIGGYAFIEVVERVCVPASVTEISDEAFDFAQKLRAVEVAESNPNYASHDGILYNKSMTTLLRCPLSRQEPVVVPTGVEVIYTTAFKGCKDIEALSLPDGLKSIGTSAFSSCRSLKSIAIPATVKDMEVDALFACTSLRDIYVSKELVEGFPIHWVPTVECRVHFY